MDSALFFILPACLLLSAYFSGMEIAFLSANKLKIELENKQGIFSARILSFFLRRSSRFIATLLVGHNLALVVFGIAMAFMLDIPLRVLWDHSAVVLTLQVLIATLLVLLAAEFIPKLIFRINPNRVLAFFAVPTLLFYFLLWLPTLVVLGCSEALMRLFFRSRVRGGSPVLGRIDLDSYFREATSGTEVPLAEMEQEILFFRNALDFSSVKARDCMIPRTEIVAVGVDESIETLSARFVETGLSKILVYRDHIDQIIGYVHSYELFRQPSDIQSVLLPVSVVPETMRAQTLLGEFIRQSRSIAVVVDEFGGTCGLVTMEDIIEQIFGDIEDEHDVEDLVEQRLEGEEYLFSGRIEIEHLNEKYLFNLPESEAYETLAGYLIHHLADIPRAADIIDIGAYTFTVVAVSGTRIALVKMKPRDAD